MRPWLLLGVLGSTLLLLFTVTGFREKSALADDFSQLARPGQFAQVVPSPSPVPTLQTTTTPLPLLTATSGPSVLPTPSPSTTLPPGSERGSNSVLAIAPNVVAGGYGRLTNSDQQATFHIVVMMDDGLVNGTAMVTHADDTELLGAVRTARISGRTITLGGEGSLSHDGTVEPVTFTAILTTGNPGTGRITYEGFDGFEATFSGSLSTGEIVIR
jgi:hypothetical protein